MSKFRPLYFWPAEVMNRLRLPDRIFRRYRRNERAALVRQARRDGIRISFPLALTIWSRAPLHERQNDD